MTDEHLIEVENPYCYDCNCDCHCDDPAHSCSVEAHSCRCVFVAPDA